MPEAFFPPGNSPPSFVIHEDEVDRVDALGVENESGGLNDRVNHNINGEGTVPGRSFPFITFPVHLSTCSLFSKMASTSSSSLENSPLSQNVGEILPARLQQTRARLEQVFQTIPSLPDAITVAKGKVPAKEAVEEG